MQRDLLLLHEMIDAAEQAQRLVAGRTVEGIDADRTEIHEIVEGLGGLLRVLRRADPADKAEVYRQLGLEICYRHMTEPRWRRFDPPCA